MTSTEFYEQLFGVRRSVRYHQRRQSYFESWHGCIAAVQVVSGSSAIAALVAEGAALNSVGIYLAAVPPLLAAVDLVFGTTRRATLHASLGRQFSQLEADMVSHEDDRESVTQGELAGFKRRRLAIQADEPPKLRVVDLLSHNDIVRGTYTHGQVYRIGPTRKLLGHVLDVNVDKALSNPRPFEPADPVAEPQPA